MWAVEQHCLHATAGQSAVTNLKCCCLFDTNETCKHKKTQTNKTNKQTPKKTFSSAAMTSLGGDKVPLKCAPHSFSLKPQIAELTILKAAVKKGACCCCCRWLLHPSLGM